ncbi:hypothetical protein OG978_32670 [Streptomyces sp. NBC_01591]|uniref:hypothetical protein n=1 Tax=Streptomyces sp. NBC_01591 TaxID=2975888 RepID=UPI002DDBB7B9|nr:hypothetical protein [Streptomyces sp. NBC_01591]WSD71728.1 hypothetical protein OG978_32670 [Streptomyces sp. NBC_01591]
MTINLFKKRGKSAIDEAPVTEPEQDQETGEKTQPAVEETELREALRELRESVRELGSQIGQGSVWLCQRCGRGVAAWCSAGHRDDLEGAPAQYGVWLRGAVILGGAYGAWRGVVAAPWVLAPAAGLWLLASLYAEAPAEPEGEDDEEKEEAAAEGGTRSDAPEPAGAAVPSVDEPPLPSHQDLHEALSRVGTPHAHIAVLAEDLGTTADAVRAALDQLAVPVAAVRMRGRGSSTGVRADKFPAPPPTPGPPSDGVVVAGQGANNDNNNAPDVVHREGLVIAYTDDKTNPVRTHVHVKTGA